MVVRNICVLSIVQMRWLISLMLIHAQATSTTSCVPARRQAWFTTAVRARTAYVVCRQHSINFFYLYDLLVLSIIISSASSASYVPSIIEILFRS